MITEDYVSYEVAKLLKEKGFDWMCNSYYTNLGRVFDHFCCHYFADDEHDKVDILTQTLRPTHQMAMKWLRERHDIHIEVIYNLYYKEYKGCMYKNIGEYNYTEFYSTYEEAVEAAIKYSLENLI